MRISGVAGGPLRATARDGYAVDGSAEPRIRLVSVTRPETLPVFGVWP